MPVPGLGVVASGKKFMPVIMTSMVWPITPEAGLTLISAGTGLFTVKLTPLETPPELLFVTVKKRWPAVAAGVIVIFAVRLVKLVTRVELTVIPVPTFTLLVSLKKLSPVKTTSSGCKRLPLAGERLVNVGGGFVTVNDSVFEMPPVAVLPTEKSRGPVAALAPMVRSAVMLVALVARIELTAISFPGLTGAPGGKLVPAKTTFKRCKRLPVFGVRLVNVIRVMVNGRLFEVPPPGPGLATEKLRGPGAASGLMLKLTVNEVGLVTTTELTVKSLLIFTLMPLMKLVPVKITSNVCPATPNAGDSDVKVGTGLLTVKVCVFEIRLPLETEKVRAPVAALGVISKLAIKLVELVTLTDLTVMPAPGLGLVRPLIKFVPVKTTSSVSKRLPLTGERPVKVGAGKLTVKTWLVDVPPPGLLLVTEKFFAPVVVVGGW